jgi:trk system potassium uptake protein TrkA
MAFRTRSRREVFVACTGLDEVNVVACGMANQLGSPQTICFVSREDFLDVSAREGALELFGVNRVVWPEAQLAADIERIVVTPGAIDAEPFEGGAVRLLEYRLGAGSPLTEGALATLHLPHGSLVVAVRRGELLRPSRRHSARRRPQGRRHGHA